MLDFLGILFIYWIFIYIEIIKYIIFLFLSLSSMCFLKKFERISAVPLSKVSVFE